MAIYADKKNGKATGRWCVEVQSKGQRLRDRCDTHAEAVIKEQEFLKAFKVGGPLPQSAKRKFSVEHTKAETFSEAIRKADGRLWAGKASEEDNISKLNTILQIMGDKPLDAIDTHFIDDLIDALAALKKADSTINRYLSAFRAFLSWCTQRNYRTVALPTFAWREEDEGRIRWITPQEEVKLKAILPETIWKVVRIAIHTGMRRGELLSIEPEQVTKGWCHLWETKSGSPRSVPLCPEDEEDLRWLAQDGNMPNEVTLRREWNEARKAMGLVDDPWFVFHACRHTCATRMVRAKPTINLAVIQKFMGHKVIATTLRYAHIDDESLTGALQAVLAHNQMPIMAGAVQ